MASRQLVRTDLNLLVTLQVLLDECNVTRAAERLFLSQPAVSKNLQKLRELFGDPLFTRTAYGLIPTPRAEELQAKLPQLLDQLNSLISTESFDAGTFNGKFRIAIPEALTQQLFPPLIKILCRDAPGMQVESVEIERHFAEQLRSGELDFAVHLAQDEVDDIFQNPVITTELHCLMRADHPLATRKITLKEYLAYPHVRLYMARITKEDIGIVDASLLAIGKKRHICFKTTQLAAALEAVGTTNCLMVAPPSFEHFTVGEHRFICKPLPRQLAAPAITFALLHHRRTDKSPAHSWLRERLLESRNDLRK